jgi:hypothetical protein
LEISFEGKSPLQFSIEAGFNKGSIAQGGQKKPKIILYLFHLLHVTLAP